MKTRFDDNVAQKIPRTKDLAEPELPWKLSDGEMSKIEAGDNEARAALTAASPLHVRAIFVALLVVTIFVVVLNGIVNVAIENSDMQTDILRKEHQVSAAKSELEKAVNEKAVLNENATKLEKRVSDLSAQKELYTAVIETLTKKTDEPLTAAN